MKKSDLKTGQIVELRNGDLCINLGIEFMCGDKWYGITSIDEDLLCKTGSDYDVMAVYDCKRAFTFKNPKYKTLVWKRKEIKLSDAERVILENMDKEISEICKSKFGTLYVVEVEAYNTFEIDIYSHLFKFIWRGEKYLIEDLLNKNREVQSE